MAQAYGIRAEKISKTYGTKEHPVRALKEISLQIQPGQFAAVLGPSGCGKSTLLHVLGGIDEPDQGNVEIKGKKLYEMKRQISEERNTPFPASYPAGSSKGPPLPGQ